MKIEIVIVSFEDQLWFELDGLKFDTLNAIWEFDRREFQVVRAGNVIARTRVTESRGEPAFNDYGVNGGIRLQGSALRAENFALQDRLVLDVPNEFDLASDLRKSCQFLEGMIATMPVGKEMSMDEMRERMAPELDRTRQTANAAQILRFRRGK